MLIKAKSLLPVMEYTEEEKEVVGNLEKKLELYKELKTAEEKLKSIFNLKVLHTREKYKFKVDFSKVPLSHIKSFTLANLHSVGLLTLAKLPNFERIRQVAVRQAIKIEHVIEKMMERISGEFTSLKEFAKGLSGGDLKLAKKSLIVSFLALLELLKQGGFEATQNNGDISVMRK
jgi:chromatin segregation and condensation protein Rec8/ScpA/Scc1 (kleisin family)